MTELSTSAGRVDYRCPLGFQVRTLPPIEPLDLLRCDLRCDAGGGDFSDEAGELGRFSEAVSAIRR
jgi:hypothetical protein